MPVDSKLQALLDKYSDELSYDEERDKVRCSVTHHDMKPDAAEVRKHTTSKRFLKAQEYQRDFSKFEPVIIPSKFSPYVQLLPSASTRGCITLHCQCSQPASLQHWTDTTSSKKLFCIACKMELNKVHDQIEGHIAGRKCTANRGMI
jgi:hypothetical protein